ncbi:unnamed protein product [Moneuplotes crassus]|uniref:Uncharacterized protein n=1 Tax=Euplotes crassus TaxID=5936 RepID=A0AAD1UCX2_EUPCR|nr:unnamed protein product [Moneuplotes crassus]
MESTIAFQDVSPSDLEKMSLNQLKAHKEDQLRAIYEEVQKEFSEILDLEDDPRLSLEEALSLKPVSLLRPYKGGVKRKVASACILKGKNLTDKELLSDLKASIVSHSKEDSLSNSDPLLKSIRSLQIIDTELNKKVGKLLKLKILTKIKSLTIEDCKIKNIPDVVNLLQKYFKELQEISIIDPQCTKNERKELLDMIQHVVNFTAIFQENALTEISYRDFSVHDIFIMLHPKAQLVTIQNIRLGIHKKHDENDIYKHFMYSDPVPHLKYLNLASCMLDNKAHKLVMSFILQCPNLKICSLKNNCISSLQLNVSSLKGVKDFGAKPEDPSSYRLSCLIDYRGNMIKNQIAKSYAHFYEDCTLLLWNNPVVHLKEIKIDENHPEHIYFPEDGADLHFDNLLYKNPSDFLA